VAAPEQQRRKNMTLIYIAVIIMLLWLIVKKLPSMVELDREQKRLEKQYEDRCAEFDKLENAYCEGHLMLIAQLEKYNLTVDEGTGYVVPTGPYGLSRMPIPPEGIYGKEGIAGVWKKAKAEFRLKAETDKPLSSV
jgi:hypothetical protein